jgi:4-carboxymuconolactone decarboxylase
MSPQYAMSAPSSASSPSTEPRHPLEEKIMTEQPRQTGGGRRSIGDIAPKLAAITDDVLFDDVWNRAGLSARDRSLITVAALVHGGDAEQLRFHAGHAQKNGVTADELIEVVTHLAFYAGWPKAMSAVSVLKDVLGDEVRGAA